MRVSDHCYAVTGLGYSAPWCDAGGVSDWQQWLQSLDRITALRPEVIVPGHGPICRGSQVSDAINRMGTILHQAIATGKSPTA